MTPFAQVDSVFFGCHRLLRALHNEQMQRFRQAPPDERERHAEAASRTRELMSRMELAGLIRPAARGYGR